MKFTATLVALMFGMAAAFDIPVSSALPTVAPVPPIVPEPPVAPVPPTNCVTTCNDQNCEQFFDCSACNGIQASACDNLDFGKAILCDFCVIKNECFCATP